MHCTFYSIKTISLSTIWVSKTITRNLIKPNNNVVKIPSNFISAKDALGKTSKGKKEICNGSRQLLVFFESSLCGYRWL
jgi:hypothetical protein